MAAESKYGGLDSRVADERARSQDYENRLRSVMMEIGQLKPEYESTLRELNRSKTYATDLERRVRALEEEIIALQQKLAIETQKYRSIENSLPQYQSELTNMNNQLEGCKRDLEASQRKAQTLEIEKQNLDKDLKKSKEEVASADSELSKSQSRRCLPKAKCLHLRRKSCSLSRTATGPRELLRQVRKIVKT